MGFWDPAMCLVLCGAVGWWPGRVPGDLQPGRRELGGRATALSGLGALRGCPREVTQENGPSSSWRPVDVLDKAVSRELA